MQSCAIESWQRLFRCSHHKKNPKFCQWNLRKSVARIFGQWKSGCTKITSKTAMIVLIILMGCTTVSNHCLKRAVRKFMCSFIQDHPRVWNNVYWHLLLGKVASISFQVGVAALFYIPRAIWLVMEGGLMKFLTRGVSGKVVEDAARKRETLVKTFQGKYFHFSFVGVVASNPISLKDAWFL